MKTTIEDERDPLTMMEPSDASAAFVAKAYDPPAWATGYISKGDTRFLYQALAELTPAIVMEIGVASGVSTVLLLEAIAALGLETRLYSFDISDCFYDKPELPLGHYIFERYESTPDRLSLHPRVPSMHIAERLMETAGAEADFTFIDANHYHPWPCLDLLAIVKAVKPGSWIALHDIDLPNLAPEFQCYGPLRLFENWPGERRKLALQRETPNIGAIKLFESAAETADAVLRVMEIPWDVHVDFREFEQVEALLKRLGGGRARRLRSIHFRNMAAAERRKYLIEKTKDLLRPLLGRPVRAHA